MRDGAPKAVRLADYTPPPYFVDTISLTFRLAPHATRVLARIAFRPNPKVKGQRDLSLDGETLKLVSASVDGTDITDRLAVDDQGLRLPAGFVPNRPFLWEAEVEIDPGANTELEGLYMSKGMYCTQCEAEGFRKITYFPDRPDVMAIFTVRIESDLPVMLSNGNPTGHGKGWAEWHDPWPKPSYLFALVAGDLRATRDRFSTVSGSPVDLAIWVRPGDESKTDYAMDALKRSMRWDEENYGREYDLEVFNIVAVDDFNLGAMENKGLNIFNSKYVLASPETATDRDYELIEGIIAHEYFHNWTGNRVTCRDWFQLCLKEGLTVFRDQEFSGDQRSWPVKRIDDVLTLRARQFREDNGPLAHPVRPASYVEINNFYTATVYEKGAEVIGMLKTLVGDTAWRDALDLYFERFDGCAATVEDWLGVFEEASGRSLEQFKLWYTQSGTPRLHVRDNYRDGTYTLHFRQETPATPGQPEKKPQLIPIAVGLLDPDGTEIMPTRVLEFGEEESSFHFDGVDRRPVPSLLRDFSAPVLLVRESSAEERAFLLANDTDPFNRWDAGRALAKDVLTGMVTENAEPGPAYLDALRRMARDEALDPAFRALALRIPSEDDMAQTLFDAGRTPEPLSIHRATRALKAAIARHLADDLTGIYEAMAVPGPYTPDARAAGRRALRRAALALMAELDEGRRAIRAFMDADNMTDQIGALGILLDIGGGQEQLAQFYRQWSADRLVIDKWFSLQIAEAAPERAATVAEDLTLHDAFDWRNPNRFRAVFGALAGNAAGFHAPDGRAYRLTADWLIRMDPVNPQAAARMTTVYETWRRYDADRQALIRGALERIADAPGLSRDTSEMVDRMLNA